MDVDKELQNAVEEKCKTVIDKVLVDYKASANKAVYIASIISGILGGALGVFIKCLF